MIGSKKVIAIVPARGGSKRLPGKNLLPVAGRPMIAWTIAVARESKYVDLLIVSTDEPAIADVARQYGADVPFLRPAHLAADDTTSVDTVMHALDSVGGDFEIAIMLQPTSPLRLREDIDGAIEAFVGSAASAGVSVYRPAKPIAWSMTVNSAGQLTPIFGPEGPAGTAPQDVYFPNGATFVVDIASFRHQKTFYPRDAIPFVMPASRSIDVDTEDDLALADHLLRRRANHGGPGAP